MQDLIQRFPQLAKEPLLSSRNRATPRNRVWAKLFDTIIVLAFTSMISFLFGRFWIWIVPTLLWSGLDRMGRGQSPGKWLLGLHTIETRKGEKVSVYAGFIRNLPLIVGTWGWYYLGIESLVIWAFMGLWIVMELYFIYNLRSGVRVGDVIAGTRVWDYKDLHTRFLEQFLKEEEHA